MQKKFTPMGKIQKHHDALQVQVDGWKLGELVIAAADVPKMLNGRVVDVQFVQERPGHEVFVGHAGSARISRSGRAVNVRIESRLMSAPLAAVQKVITGQQLAARLSAPAPIIDADREQAKSIDHDLVRSFA
ncbi:hypothetical protein SAMN04488571_103267 [Methanoculleus thermophilus]|uniref:Uncharacterized protein n=2 Tax=Methanoculleus thermophilus TaxID=2200 RepID=A0A1G8YXY6_9EURY|nr:hypothetical protein SAMN04488571_103267 [Methanoculleus thermophilus]